MVYHSPVNPDGKGSFETDLLPQFRALMTRLTTERQVPYRDYADALPASVFRFPFMGRPDAVHLAATGRAWLARTLADELASRLTIAPETRR